ncbi:Holliday junction resolvase [archaeon]|nr:Holliday junction resolvase [archaeon]|tara:strand:+ start:3114 stop:3458 length:345 start_codon:yes stop_codon:yes gene_type:complete
MFFENSHSAIRVAGSGSTPLLASDIIAGVNGRALAIECKSGKGKRYITKKQIDELREFSKRFGAESWVGVRFDREGWYFLSIEDLNMSSTGNNYVVDISLAKKKGLDFNELIKV